jgi:hypothetical protein
MDFPEGSNVKAPGNEISSGAFLKAIIKNFIKSLFRKEALG